jgi:hypothetical protein
MFGLNLGQGISRYRHDAITESGSDPNGTYLRNKHLM